MRVMIGFVFAALFSLATLACAHAGALDPSVEVAVSPGDIVDLNTATERDLIELPGIGPAKAAAIVAYRKKHGAFTRVEDLRKVRGFGRKTVARLRTMLTVTRSKPDGPAPPTTARPVAAASGTTGR